VIRRIIGGFDRDTAEAIASRGLLHPPVDPATLAAFARLSAALAAGDAVDPADVRALDLADNPGCVLLEAEALAARGEAGAAEEVLAGLTRRLGASPVLSTLPKRWQKQVWRRRIDLLDGLGRREPARVLAAEAARLFPTDAGFAVERSDLPLGQQD
jgi:hypothetical protein